MHDFGELAKRSTFFNLKALELAQKNIFDDLQTNASSILVKNLQMVQLQKAISAVGMFSMFDAELQQKLQSNNGFNSALALLQDKGELDLKEQFINLQLAVNVLKHGKGRSYDTLVQKAVSLPFKIKLPNETSFNESDVSEISTLIEVDDAFVLLCAEVIYKVSIFIRTANQ